MELAIGTLIKIILGVFVFVIVVVSVALFFKDKVIGFFQNFSFDEASKLFLNLI